MFYLSFSHSLSLLDLSNLNILLSATCILLLSSECTDSAVTSSNEAFSFQNRHRITFFQDYCVTILLNMCKKCPLTNDKSSNSKDLLSVLEKST